jgi:hypothetical protein
MIMSWSHVRLAWKGRENPSNHHSWPPHSWIGIDKRPGLSGCITWLLLSSRWRPLTGACFWSELRCTRVGVVAIAEEKEDGEASGSNG